MAGAERIVGRSAELAVLVDALGDAVRGNARVVLVTGEAGIGKTRLIGEFALLAGARSVPVVWGRATTAEGAPAFWPWRQVFRSWSDDPGGLSGRDRGLARPNLALIAPELGSDASAAMTDAAPADAEQRFALFEEACSLITTAADADGLVILLDDLHWADTASLRLLAHLVASVRSARLLVVAAYRPDDLGSDTTAAALLDQIGTSPAIRRLELSGLSADEVGEQLRTVLGTEPDTRLTDRVARRTGGNPLFVQEVGRLLAVGSDAVPSGVRAVLDRRLGTLSDGTRQLLEAAAVVGVDIDPAAVAALTATEPSQLLHRLDEAIGAGLVRRTRTTGGYAFAHDLVRDCCLLALGEAERASLHLAVAERLEQADGDSDLTAIAHHRLAALPLGDPIRAAAAAADAGRLAVRQLAYDDAARLFERAVDAAEQARAPTEDRARLLIDLARVHHLGMDGPGARDACRRAAALCQRTGDVERLAEAALVLEDITEPDWATTVKEWCDTCLDALPRVDTPLRARLLALRAVVSLIDGDNERLGDLSASALNMADRTNDPEALGSALRARQLARSSADGVYERLDLADRMAALSTRTGDVRSTMWGHLWRFDALVQLGDIDAAEVEISRLEPIVEALRQPLGYWHLRRSQATVHLGRGRFDAALDADEKALSIAVRSGHDGAMFISAAVRQWRSILIGREELGDIAHPPPTEGPPVWAAIANLGFGEWHLAFGRREEAHRHYAALPPLSSPLPPFLQMGLTAGRAALAAGLGDADTAAAVYPRLLAYADFHAAGGAGAIITRGSTQHFLGIAAAAAGDVAGAVTHLQASITANRGSGLAPHVAESCCRLAELLADRSTGDESLGSPDPYAREAKSIAERLGMRLVAERADAVLAAAETATDNPLSRREREVARLVADGLTNRQIADALHISERTAENHVQHILTKLGRTSRTQIAVWVAGGGLDSARS